jgi:hypothetical protein
MEADCAYMTVIFLTDIPALGIGSVGYAALQLAL